MMSELANRLSAVDLRVSDASVLMLIGAEDSLTSSDIGRLLDIQRANMVPLLNRLDAAKLIARVPLDRKSMAITLTPLGQERLREARAITEQFERDLMARVPEEHRDHLVPALNALWS